MSIISVRVDYKVKKRLEEAGVDVPHEVRRRLEELAWQVELTERMAGLEKLVKRMPPAPKGFSTKSVKEYREGH
jgi:hypothetical protein